MALQLAVLEACFAKAAEGAKVALQRSIDDAITALQIAETQSLKVAERDLLNTACRGLIDFKVTWVDGYKKHLTAEFDAAKTTALAFDSDIAGSVRPRGPSTPSPAANTPTSRLGALALVDDQQVLQTIESARLLQQMLTPLEQSLPELDKLISSAQGLNRVRPELNPLRPDVFATCLLDLLYGVAAPPAITALWIKNLGAPLGRELADVYASVVNLLELADVRGAAYQVVQTSDGRGDRAQTADRSPTSRQPPSGTPSQDGTAVSWPNNGSHVNIRESVVWPSEPASAQADLSRPSLNAALFEDFVLQGGKQSAQTLSPAYRERLQAEFTALANAGRQDAATRDNTAAHYGRADAVVASASSAPSSAYQNLPAVDRPPRGVTEDTELNSRFWGTYAQAHARAVARSRLKANASEVGQVMGLEVVRQLVHEVAQDARLLAPVRESIVALEPALSRLAMQDPRFLSNEKHPGRLLLERVTQRSFKFNDEFSPEFGAFFKPLTHTVNALNGEGAIDAHRFETALWALENEWAVQDTAEAARRHDMVEKMRFAEARQTQADEIAYELSTRSDLDGVPGMVLDFLFGHWSLAMAHARLCDTRNQLDPEGFGSAVPDLVWSAKPQATIRQPAKLIEMIPGLLGKLHSGLQMLGTDTDECAPFFDGLMKLHQPVLKLRRLKSQRDAQESNHALLSVTASLMDELASAESEPATAEQRRAKVAATPWLGKHELADAGFQDTLPTDYDALMPAEGPPAADVAAPQHPSEPQPSEGSATTAVEVPDPNAPAASILGEGTEPQPPHALPAAEAMLLALRAGDWVDLYSRRRWLRAQLTWASSKGTLFMFVSHGGQPHSMTKRSCERLIAGRLLRPVKSHGVVAHALESVAANAKALPSGRAAVSVD